MADDVRLAKRMSFQTAVWDPDNIATDATSTTTTVSVKGSMPGDLVLVGHSALAVGGAILSGEVTAAGTVTVTLFNNTGGALNVASGTLKVIVIHTADM